MDSDMIELENMLSDIREWKTEAKELEKEQEKIADRLEGIDSDITTTYAAIDNFIRQLSEPED